MLRSTLEENVYLSGTAEIVVSKEQVSSDLGDEAAILSLKNGVYYGLDSVGARVWSLIQQPRTLSYLRDIIAAEYEVDGQRLESDLRNLVTDLAAQQLVEISE
jgi:hypothetical protein